jgi:hypothetical protein
VRLATATISPSTPWNANRFERIDDSACDGYPKLTPDGLPCPFHSIGTPAPPSKDIYAQDTGLFSALIHAPFVPH